jgi:NAD(P)-dependent dehydrogenase (short-subunit alcohol dehydrogenase family)
MDLRLAGKSALVTGSTAGIGLEIARRLSAEGVGVVVAGRSKAKLDEAMASVAALAPKDAPPTRAILADVATAEGAATVVRELPQVDILVNNLGIYEAKPFAEITDEDWHKLFEVNLVSGARLARHYFPGMLARDWGRIIFIASESAVMIPSEMIHYGLTKTAQLSLSRGLAALSKGSKVTVNAVMPGPTQSEGIADFLRSVASDPKAPLKELEAEFFRIHRPTSLIQRMIEADEIASLVAYVASPLSAAINGAALRVDGGITPTIV